MSMQPVLHSFAYGLDFLREQVADVSSADMVRQPSSGASEIRNHPAWVLGHLTLTCQELGGAIGLAAWLPDDWPRRFGTGSEPVADARLYEPKATALATLSDTQIRITRAVEQLDDTRLDQPFPDPAYLAVFPTLRHAITQVLVGHAAYHIGQVNLWRKAMGLPKVSRSFE